MTAAGYHKFTLVVYLCNTCVEVLMCWMCLKPVRVDVNLGYFKSKSALEGHTLSAAEAFDDYRRQTRVGELVLSHVHVPATTRNGSWYGFHCNDDK
jgi:hypothetical protein